MPNGISFVDPSHRARSHRSVSRRAACAWQEGPQRVAPGPASLGAGGRGEHPGGASMYRARRRVRTPQPSAESSRRARIERSKLSTTPARWRRNLPPPHKTWRTYLPARRDQRSTPPNQAGTPNSARPHVSPRDGPATGPPRNVATPKSCKRSGTCRRTEPADRSRRAASNAVAKRSSDRIAASALPCPPSQAACRVIVKPPCPARRKPRRNSITMMRAARAVLAGAVSRGP